MAEYTLEELAELTGITARTIRSYIEKGLLPGPGSTGPKARYSDQHLDKLKTILHLKQGPGLNLDLGDIRQLLMTVSDQALREVNTQEQARGESLNDTRSVLEYIRRVAGEAPEAPRSVRRAQSAQSAMPQPEPPSGPLTELVEGLKYLTRDRTVRRRARSEGWRRIEVTPDIEINVRASLPHADIRQIEHIADHLRTLLLGG